MDREKLKNVSWDAAVRIGVDLEYLKRMGYMEVLLEGGQTPPMNLLLNMNGTVIWMEGTIRLTEDESGEIMVDIQGINPDDDAR